MSEEPLNASAVDTASGPVVGEEIKPAGVVETPMGPLVVKQVESAAEVLGPPKYEIPTWKKALSVLWAIFWAGFVGFLAQLVTDHPQEIAAAILLLVPASLKPFAAMVLGSAATAFVQYLSKRKRDAIQIEKRDALATAIPPDIGKYF